jgi:hypothetical protein
MTPFPLKGVLPRFLRLIEMRAPADAAALAVVQIQLGYRPEQVIRDLLEPAGTRSIPVTPGGWTGCPD